MAEPAATAPEPGTPHGGSDGAAGVPPPGTPPPPGPGPVREVAERARERREQAERLRAEAAAVREGRAGGGILRQQLLAANDAVQNLQRALHTNRRIGVAVGILMTRLGVTEQHAFDLLREHSQRRNMKLRDLAEQVVWTGQLGD